MVGWRSATLVFLKLRLYELAAKVVLLIVSYDTIISLRPPYAITPTILRLLASIAEKVGAVNARYLVRQNPILRKRNRIRTIQASLQIEGNTLSEEQVTAILEKKRVMGPASDIREVMNAMKLYDSLKSLRCHSERDFRRAHALLMDGLSEEAGNYRSRGVGIVKGRQVKHLAPPASRVSLLMKDLFAYLKHDPSPGFIKSCVFHYELEFIHPFLDGNGRMGRCWQTAILMSEYPVFEFLPFETLIAKQQARYYQALAASDKQGASTPFIEFMLLIIDEALAELLATEQEKLSGSERLSIFLESVTKEFARQDYRKHFPDLSTATASRDLRQGVEQGLLRKRGDKKLTVYRKAGKGKKT